MVPTDNQQGELFEVEHGLRKVGQLVFIQEEALQLFQPVEEKPGLRTGSTGIYGAPAGKACSAHPSKTCVQPQAFSSHLDRVMTLF